MKRINVDKLDIFQLHSLKEILDERAEYYSKSIPNYALIVGNEQAIQPQQRIMLDKYNIIKTKSSRVASMIEDYILNTLFNEET